MVSTNHSSPGHHQVPLPVGHVVAQVGRVARDQQIQLEYILKNISCFRASSFWLCKKLNIRTIVLPDLEAIVSPAGELHGAGLLVEGEELYVDLAAGLEDGGAEPRHVTRTCHDRVGAGQLAGARLRTNQR